MTIEQTIKKAIEGGYEPDDYDLRALANLEKDSASMPESVTAMFVLDPQFWQSLGKSMGWEQKGNYILDSKIKGSWIVYWHDFINNLAAGKSIESFFKDLN